MAGLRSPSAWGAAAEDGSINKAGPLRSSHPANDPVKTLRIALAHGATPLSPYMGGGIITEKKEPFTVSFRSFAACCDKPGGVVMAGDGGQGFLMTDMTFSMAQRRTL